ncbi:MAG: molybdopterin-dependent oxidoreductase [Steroidobacteraceae bacterium]
MTDCLPQQAGQPWQAAPRHARSFCRICAGNCALLLTVEDEKVIGARGDKSNPLTRGYACIKGLHLHDAHNSPERLLHPLKRQADGSFVRIALEEALDEIAGKLRTLLARGEPDSIAAFRGTLNYSNLVANQMLPDWLRSLGSRSFFSTMTIDQSAKWVTAERLGRWAAGPDSYEHAEVLLLVGTNPLVSLSTFNCALQDPARALKAFKERGGKLIVVDPRRTETARHADVFLQPLPGEDPTLVAGLLHLILSHEWHDAEFCERHVSGMEQLRAAVASFTPEYVARRAGVAEADLRSAAEMFARSPGEKARRGSAASGTGPDMAPHSNLSEHLIQCLNVICGRFARAGDRVQNPGVIGGQVVPRAEVVPPQRSWETGPKSPLSGFGSLFGEKMTGTLVDEITTAGRGRIRALFVDGGNPVNAIPDQHAVVQALSQLELLVTIDPFMTSTAKLSHYILPPTMMFERADLTTRDYEKFVLFRPYACYTEAVVQSPPGSELVEDWYPFWALARRLGLTIEFDGVQLDMHKRPDADELLGILARNGAVPFAELKRLSAGRIFDLAPQFIQPAAGHARFEVAPVDIVQEIGEVLAEDAPQHVRPEPFPFRLTVRRMRDVQNTMYHHLPAIRRRVPYNPAWLHPEDLQCLGLEDGALATIISDHGQIPAVVRSDPTMRKGVVSMTHGWGGLPAEPADYRQVGSNPNLLINSRHRDPINAMPVMSAIPVRIERSAPTPLSCD